MVCNFKLAGGVELSLTNEYVRIYTEWERVYILFSHQFTIRYYTMSSLFFSQSPLFRKILFGEISNVSGQKFIFTTKFPCKIVHSHCICHDALNFQLNYGLTNFNFHTSVCKHNMKDFVEISCILDDLAGGIPRSERDKVEFKRIDVIHVGHFNIHPL